MTHVTAETAKKTDEDMKGTQELSGAGAGKAGAEGGSLEGRYRQIGISAVAAAARYQGVAKNPAYAPAPVVERDRAEEPVG
jgi:hypothetical protein